MHVKTILSHSIPSPQRRKVDWFSFSGVLLPVTTTCLLSKSCPLSWCRLGLGIRSVIFVLSLLQRHIPEKSLNFPAGCSSTSFALRATQLMCCPVGEDDGVLEFECWDLTGHLFSCSLIWVRSREALTSLGCLVKVDLELRYADSTQSSDLSFLSQVSSGESLGDSHKVIVQDQCTDSGGYNVIPGSIPLLLTPATPTLVFRFPFRCPSSLPITAKLPVHSLNTF